ncbi:MAG: hypothetical protein U5L45_24265 [Saprospiraceae bacterium]|nr:hypothetical protein [Saprospiraceae bacterium]
MVYFSGKARKINHILFLRAKSVYIPNTFGRAIDPSSYVFPKKNAK